MKEHTFESARYEKSDEIDLRELFLILWRARWLIIGCTVFAGLLAAGISMTMPNIYRAQVLLAPAEEASGGGLAALAGQLGGLASLAGVNIGKSEASKTAIAMEVLKSRAFVTNFVRQREIVVPLMAATEWDANNGELVFNGDVYDALEKRWVVQGLNKKSEYPTDWDIYNRFAGIMEVQKDKGSGLITVSVDFYSPVLAKQWADWLIEDVNAQVRKMDVDEATKSIEYLKRQLQQVSIKEMQQIFYQLIEKQTQTIMLANVRDQYVFKVIDPAVVPQAMYGPKRTLIVSVSIIAAFFLSALIAVLASLFKAPVMPKE